MIFRLTEEYILKRAWKEVDQVWKRGDRCGDCVFFSSSPGSWDEPPWSECATLEAGESPFECPGVSRKDVTETLVAEAEEASEKD